MLLIIPIVVAGLIGHLPQTSKMIRLTCNISDEPARRDSTDHIHTYPVFFLKYPTGRTLPEICGQSFHGLIPVCKYHNLLKL